MRTQPKRTTPGRDGAVPRRRGRARATAWVLLAGILLAVLVPAGVRADTPPERLAGLLPGLFPAASLGDAAVGGETGARIVACTEAQHQFGLQQDDVILAVGGRALGEGVWEPPPADSLTLTVWRRLPGARPVLEPGANGRRILDEFVTLPDPERTPMRLALMLANQQTLVRDGSGVVLVPARGVYDDALWLGAANPLPAASEVALREAVEVLLRRAGLPAAHDGEARRAAAAHDRRNFLEAQERAARAMAQYVVDPRHRAERAPLDSVTALYARARAAEQRRQALLLAPEERLTLVLEAQAAAIGAFLPQYTLFEVKDSRGAAFAAGARLHGPLEMLPFQSGRWPARNIDLLLAYGQVRNRFEDATGRTLLETLVQPLTAELAYRPRLAARLKPFLRGGLGVFPLRARVRLDDGSEATAISRTNLGWTLGGGIDFLNWQAARLRASVVGSYRGLKYRFLLPPVWDQAANYRLRHPDLLLDPPGVVTLDMSGWQAGIMLRVALTAPYRPGRGR